MAQWHFQKGGTSATCQHGMQNTRVDAKQDGYSPPGDWRCSGNVIQRSSAALCERAGELFPGWKNGDRAWKWEATWQKRKRSRFGSGWSWESQPQWWLTYDLDHGTSLLGSSLGVSDIGRSARCLVSDLWSLTIADLVSVIQTTRSGVKSVTSFFCLSHLFKPLYMNDSS